jgi:hypothetical protein
MRWDERVLNRAELIASAASTSNVTRIAATPFITSLVTSTAAPTAAGVGFGFGLLGLMGRFLHFNSSAFNTSNPFKMTTTSANITSVASSSSSSSLSFNRFAFVTPSRSIGLIGGMTTSTGHPHLNFHSNSKSQLHFDFGSISARHFQFGTQAKQQKQHQQLVQLDSTVDRFHLISVKTATAEAAAAPTSIFTSTHQLKLNESNGAAAAAAVASVASQPEGQHLDHHLAPDAAENQSNSDSNSDSTSSSGSADSNSHSNPGFQLHPSDPAALFTRLLLYRLTRTGMQKHQSKIKPTISDCLHSITMIGWRLETIASAWSVFYYTSNV